MRSQLYLKYVEWMIVSGMNLALSIRQLVTIYLWWCYLMEKICGGLRRKIVAYIVEDVRSLTTRLARCPARSPKIRFRIFHFSNRRYFSSLLFLFRLLLLYFLYSRSAQFLFPILHTEFESYQYDQTIVNDRSFLMGAGKLPPTRLSIISAIVLECDLKSSRATGCEMNLWIWLTVLTQLIIILLLS